jgi:proline iminopeptidase
MPSVEANGLRLEYEACGNEKNPPMVLVMGLGVHMLFWPDALCETLAAEGFHVIRIDNRDCGLSSSLDHLGVPSVGIEYLKYQLRLKVKAPYLIDDMAKDTAAFIDALGLGRAHIVGASMGGMIGQNLAAQFPEKVLTLTSIMSSTGSRALPGPRPKALRAILQPGTKPGDIEAGTRRMMNVLRVIGSQAYPTPEAELRAFCERHVRRAQNPAGQMRQLTAIAASGDRTAIVRRIKAPTLVLHGTDDPLLPAACGEATARAIQEGGGDATYVALEGMGHDFPAPLVPRIAKLIVERCRAARA